MAPWPSPQGVSHGEYDLLKQGDADYEKLIYFYNLLN